MQGLGDNSTIHNHEDLHFPFLFSQAEIYLQVIVVEKMQMWHGSCLLTWTEAQTGAVLLVAEAFITKESVNVKFDFLAFCTIKRQFYTIVNIFSQNYYCSTGHRI